ncbi:hypothetical protein [Actinacidiphila sp. ITFR-21]|uniref:hypothetical protein n=1 Tax=Actinacidiphila sp. ITFR-21 TaxID=3075199 RepID=UPI00288A208A|nr:hypothetical protein [Streptomyces sp. ITFR-21]WNI19135.1 hypothetical protein RLT57_28765 [Streptomyces sp. ITFR-21]
MNGYLAGVLVTGSRTWDDAQAIRQALTDTWGEGIVTPESRLALVAAALGVAGVLLVIAGVVLGGRAHREES